MAPGPLISASSAAPEQGAPGPLMQRFGMRSHPEDVMPQAGESPATTYPTKELRADGQQVAGEDELRTCAKDPGGREQHAVQDGAGSSDGIETARRTGDEQRPTRAGYSVGRRGSEEGGPPTPSAAAEVPGEHLKDHIRREVLAVLVVLARGRSNAMTGERLAELVAERLREAGREVHLSAPTMRRRCQEAVAELVEAGEEIASSSSPPRGYYIPETKEEIDAGARELWTRLASLARRGRRYDRNTADRLLELLGQLGIDVGGAA
jgi:hypothetical protein